MIGGDNNPTTLSLLKILNENGKVDMIFNESRVKLKNNGITFNRPKSKNKQVIPNNDISI